MTGGGRRATLDPAETEALLRTFSDYVWKADVDGRLATDMPQWRAITGQRPDEVLGDGWIEGVHPDDREAVAAAWQAAVKAKGVYDIEYRVTGPGGERWYNARAAPVLDDDGEVDRWVGTVADVTERHRAADVKERLQAELLRERALLEQVIAEAPTAIAVVWGPDHEYRFVNEGYQRVVPRRVRPGDTVAGALPEAIEIIEVLNTVRAGEPYRFDELRVPFAGPGSFDGHRYYQGVYAPVLEDGRPGGVLAMATEVTEQVRQREDLVAQLRHERQAAERLQRALLPDEPPVLAGLDVALVYLPAGQDVGVGGDWYDVLDVEDGRALLVIGDVAGRGMQAATWMSQMRSAVRAYAVEDPDPARLLGRCAVLSERLRMPDMISVGCGLLDRRSGELLWASAGHPAPLLLAPGRAACLAVQRPGPPLGADVRAYATTRLELEHGAAIVLYTDGAVEDRRRPIDAGIQALLAAAPDPSAGAAVVCDALARHVTGRDGEDDDVALIVVRLT